MSVLRLEAPYATALGHVCALAGPSLGCLASVAGAQEICFEEGVQLPAGSSPSGVALGDLDGDGVLDLVTTSSSGDLLYLHLGTGGGAFGPAVTHPTPDGPRTVKLADLDGDGDLDVGVGCEAGGRFAVWLNDGTGVLAPYVGYVLGAQGYSLAFADIDGSGGLDVAATVFGDARVAILLNQGGGALTNVGSVAVGNKPRSIVADDLNADGTVDLATANAFPGSLSVLRNLGCCGVPLADSFTRLDYLPPSAPLVVASADFDGDGDTDLATANEIAASISVWDNSGGGLFTLSASYPTAATSYYVTAEDLDHDGDEDLVASNLTSTGKIFFLANDGSGAFDPASVIAQAGKPFACATGDVDGNGRRDVVYVSLDDQSSQVLLDCTAIPPGGALAGTPDTISTTAGGTQDLLLSAGSPNAGRLYALVGSISGTAPGFPLAPGLLLPLNIVGDAYFLVTVNSPSTTLVNPVNVLDAAGHASAAFTLPVGIGVTFPALVGVTAHHAFVLITPAIDFASNAVPCTLLP